MNPDQTLFNAAESKRRAERGQALATRANPNQAAMIADAFLQHLREISPTPGTSDTLRAAGGVPADVSPNVVGAAFSRLRRADLIRVVGVTTGTRPGAHGAKLYQWRLAAELEREGVENE